MLRVRMKSSLLNEIQATSKILMTINMNDSICTCRVDALCLSECMCVCLSMHVYSIYVCVCVCVCVCVGLHDYSLSFLPRQDALVLCSILTW